MRIVVLTFLLILHWHAVLMIVVVISDLFVNLVHLECLWLLINLNWFFMIVSIHHDIIIMVIVHIFCKTGQTFHVFIL